MALSNFEFRLTVPVHINVTVSAASSEDAYEAVLDTVAPNLNLPVEYTSGDVQIESV